MHDVRFDHHGSRAAHPRRRDDLVMAVDRIGERPAGCSGCDWRTWVTAAGGGHCIPIDPNYLSHRVRTLGYPFRFVELAQETNGRMPG
jgi:hypothetical protein